MGIKVTKIKNIDLVLKSQLNKKIGLNYSLSRQKATLTVSKNKFKKMFRNSNLYIGLSGAHAGNTDGSDLEAELGLARGIGKDVMEELLEIILDSFSIKYMRDPSFTNGSFKFQIDLTLPDPLNYTKSANSISGASYISHGKDESSTFIPWLQMILDYNGTGKEFEGQVATGQWGIVYGGSGDSAFLKSRSGRAIMFKKITTTKKQSKKASKASGSRFPWILPSLIKPPAGFNSVIDSLLLDPSFRGQLVDLLNRHIWSIIKRKYNT